MTENAYSSDHGQMNTPEETRLQLELASFVSIIYELLKTSVVEKTRSFLTSGEPIRDREILGVASKNFSFAHASKWFLDNGIITADDVKALDDFRSERNKAVHETIELAIGWRKVNQDPVRIDPYVLPAALSVYKKVEEFWIGIESSIDPDRYTGEDGRLLAVVPGSFFMVDHLLNVVMDKVAAEE